MIQKLPANMRAWRSSRPGIAGLELTELPIPHPGPKEALVRVDTAALNFSDLLMIDDRYQVRPDRPFVPGQEISGTVVRAGTQSNLALGERIASKVLWGGFAEFALVRTDMAIRISADMPAESAAALPIVYVTAMVALTESTTVKTGETVLVLAAAGGIGMAAVEIARHQGARVIAAAGGEDKCWLARQHGAHEAVDYGVKGWSQRVKTLTSGRGVDIIVDPVGGDASKDALHVIAQHGRMLIVGFASGEIPQISASRLLLKRASAIGVYWNHDHDATMLFRVSERLVTFIRQGAIRPHIGMISGFEDLPQALEALAQRRTTGKAVIKMTSQEASR